MPDLRDKLSELIQRYERDRTAPRTEADVSANFIDYLFAALGWDITNPNEYNRQRYVREAGFADIGLLLRGEPRLFVEVKRFGMIPKSTERVGDRTPEEKQAFKYARQEKIKWAVLTNFERLHVFDADQERLILAFDDPQDYPRRIEDLNRLAKANIERDSLEHLGQLEAKEDLDRGFLESLKSWRKLLAQDILDRNPDNEVLLTNGQPDLDKLRRVVQRILDRLVIIRYADDRELLDDFGVIEAMHAGFKARRSYAAEGKLYRDFLDFCAGMDRKHNTEIFSPKHPCEQVTVGNDCLDQLLAEITAISFRKFTSDVLGNTYETYLGHRLVLEDGRINLSERRDLRKGAGIYYTPPYIVHYIVDNTLGRELEELKAQYGLSAGHEARKLKVLDPACGSGSFLIYAFDVLAKFYEGCNERVTAENTRLLKESKPGEQLETQAAIKSLPKRLYHFPKIILEENLYGVDLDEEAAELASVNLIMKAFDRVSSNGRKLPLILNQNIKVGNSLIGCVPGAKLWEKTSLTSNDLKQLITLRQQIRETDDDATKRKLLDEATDRTRQIAAPLDEPLKQFFVDPAAKHPFHWAVEFPEVFSNSGGFDVVVGNPPYLMLQNAANERDTFLFAKAAFYVAQYKIDTYHLFLERAIEALKANGRQGFITPNTFLRNKFCLNLREYLLTRCILERIVTIPEQVFPDASVDTAIIITKKSQEAAHEIEFSDVSSAVSELAGRIRYSRTQQDKLTASNEYQIELVADDPLSRCFTRVFSDCVPLGSYVEPYFGIQTFDREKYVSDRKLDASYRKALDGTNIERYRILDSSEYVCTKPDAIKSGGDTNVYEQDKILVRQIGEFPVAALDTNKHYCLNTIYSMTTKGGSYDLRYFLALINSTLIQAYWRFRFFDYKATFPKIKKAPLQNIPIRAVNFNERAEKRSYSQIVDGAKHMLRLQTEKGHVERSFADALNNHPHEWRELGDTYWNRPEYVKLIEKKSHIKPTDTGTVTGFRCEMDDKTIQITAQVADDWKPVVDMTVVDQKLRLFILYGIRQFLRDNSRKRKWGEGKLLALTLETIQVPVFLSHGVHDVDTQLRTLKLVLAEMKKHSPLLNPTELERNITATDRQIDQLVYELYGLTKEEISLVESGE